jgi:hypothetical protein
MESGAQELERQLAANRVLIDTLRAAVADSASAVTSSVAALDAKLGGK